MAITKTQSRDKAPSQSLEHVPVLTTHIQITKHETVEHITAELDNCNVILAHVYIEMLPQVWDQCMPKTFLIIIEVDDYLPYCYITGI